MSHRAGAHQYAGSTVLFLALHGPTNMSGTYPCELSWDQLPMSLVWQQEKKKGVVVVNKGNREGEKMYEKYQISRE